MKKLHVIIIISLYLLNKLQSQNEIWELAYYPTSVKSIFLNSDEKVNLEIGVNNYALDFYALYRYKKIAFGLKYDYNGNRKLWINPLNFNPYNNLNSLSHRIQSGNGLVKAKYLELQSGYIFNEENKKIELGFGYGIELVQKMNRYFVQTGISYENELMEVGFIFRANSVTKLEKLYIPMSFGQIEIKEELKFPFIVEPNFRWMIKVWKLRIINQFGFALIINKSEDYLKPNFRIGIGLRL